MVTVSQQPLQGLKVVELHAIGPVPYTGMQLLSMGASVARVCPPQNRAVGIPINPDADLLNRGKQEHLIDLKSTSGLAQLLAMLDTADVLIEGFRPGVLERLTLEPEKLLTQFPQLVIARLSGFGRHGCYAQRAGHDINYLSLCGVLAAIGPAEEPAVPLNLIADFGGGAMHLLNGILAKLVQRGIQGNGGMVDTSILAGTFGLTPMIHSLLANQLWSLDRQSNLLDGGLPFYRMYKTKDGKFMAVGALESGFFAQLLTLLNLHDSFNVENQYKQSEWQRMIELFSGVFITRSRDDWAADAQQMDCCVTPVLNFTEALEYEHNTDNGWITHTPFKHPDHLVQFS